MDIGGLPQKTPWQETTGQTFPTFHSGPLGEYQPFIRAAC